MQPIDQEYLDNLPRIKFFASMSWDYSSGYEIGVMWDKGENLVEGDQIYKHMISIRFCKPVFFTRY